jgi:hypothetical protein
MSAWRYAASGCDAPLPINQTDNRAQHVIGRNVGSNRARRDVALKQCRQRPDQPLA